MDWNMNKVHELEDIYYDPDRDIYSHEKENDEDETDNY